MPTTDNGWPASPALRLRPLVVNGVSFVPGIVDDDAVAAVLGYVVEQYAARVEPLVSPGCWGFNYRANANSPTSLSRHSGGIAVDVNAPAHPNGVPTSRTLTAKQIAEVHTILAEVDHVVRWGGDYTGTPDSMHFEINADRAAVARVATRLNQEADMLNDADKKFITEAVTKAAHDALDELLSEKQVNGKSLRENIRIGANARDVAAEVAKLVRADSRKG